MSDQPARKETILSETKLRLYAPNCPGAERQPTLIVDIFENNPRMRVRTNVQNDSNKGYIEAPMNSKVFSKLMEGIRKLANNELFDGEGKPMTGFRVDNLGHPFLNNQRSAEKRIVSITSVSKGANGVISISITAGKNRPIIDFVFLEDDYHYFKDMNGNAMCEATSSQLAAIGWANMFEKYVAIALTDYVIPAWVLKRQAQQAANGGNGGYNGGNGGGYQKPQQQSYQSNQSSGQGYKPAATSGDIDNFDLDVPI